MDEILNDLTPDGDDEKGESAIAEAMERMLRKLMAVSAMKRLNDELNQSDADVIKGVDLQFTGVYGADAKVLAMGRLQIFDSFENLLQEMAALQPDRNEVILDLKQKGEEMGIFFTSIIIQHVWYRYMAAKMVHEGDDRLRRFMADGMWQPSIICIQLGDDDDGPDTNAQVVVTLTGDLSKLNIGPNWIPFL